METTTTPKNEKTTISGGFLGTPIKVLTPTLTRVSNHPSNDVDAAL